MKHTGDDLLLDFDVKLLEWERGKLHAAVAAAAVKSVEHTQQTVWCLVFGSDIDLLMMLPPSTGFSLNGFWIGGSSGLESSLPSRHRKRTRDAARERVKNCGWNTAYCRWCWFHLCDGVVVVVVVLVLRLHVSNVPLLIVYSRLTKSPARNNRELNCFLEIEGREMERRWKYYFRDFISMLLRGLNLTGKQKCTPLLTMTSYIMKRKRFWNILILLKLEAKFRYMYRS